MIALVLATLMLQTPMSITSVARGPVSDIQAPREVVVRTAPEWHQLWRAHTGSDSGRPNVDFGSQMVVGVFLGARTTGGYDVEIAGVELVEGALVVRYTERTPAPGAVLAQVITAPFHLVSVGKFDGPVRFERSEKRGR